MIQVVPKGLFTCKELIILVINEHLTQAYCIYSYLRFGSYPVVSIDNSLFPNDTLLPEDLDENQYSIKTRTHFQPNEMPQIDIINPLPGSWFAIAFINDDNNEAIRQEVKN